VGVTSIPPRVATLALVDGAGRVLGQLPPFEVETPWWQDVRSIVASVRERFGVDVTVLRMLRAERPAAPGGAVTYLAEVDGAAAARVVGQVAPWPDSPGHDALEDDPLRQTWARLGGPARDLAWADSELAAHGLTRIGPAEQDRTWNLSSLWRLPLASGAAWLKVVPPFFAHEGAILERLAGERVPALLAREGARMLMLDVAGDDRYEAPLPELLDMIDLLVDLQARWLGRTAELLSLGMPDWRGDALAWSIGEVVERGAQDVSTDDRAALGRFLRGLPDRFAALAGCGIGDSLVHGDFHPGNLRGGDGRLVLLDWADSGVGHPLLDQPAFLTRIPAEAVNAVRRRWHDAWHAAVPGSDPEGAGQLLAPIAAARQAVVYRRFLDNIEASEHPYHRLDVPDWLHRTADLVRAEGIELATPG
jgi:hypothetical protein